MVCLRSCLTGREKLGAVNFRPKRIGEFILLSDYASGSEFSELWRLELWYGSCEMLNSFPVL